MRSEENQVRRINRKLKSEQQRVRLCRESSSGFGELGRAFVVDDRNDVIAKDIDLDDWEKISEE